MELSENSLIAKYYKWIFHNVLPRDFCTLFWNTLFSIVFFPIIIIPYCLFWRDETWTGKSITARIIYGTIQSIMILSVGLIGLLILEKGFSIDSKILIDYNWFLAIIIGVIVSAIFGLLVVSIIILFMIVGDSTKWGYKNIKQKFSTGEKKNKVTFSPKEYIVAIYNTIRNKYCTKITWKA